MELLSYIKYHVILASILIPSIGCMVGTGGAGSAGNNNNSSSVGGSYACIPYTCDLLPCGFSGDDGCGTIINCSSCGNNGGGGGNTGSSSLVNSANSSSSSNNGSSSSANNIVSSSGIGGASSQSSTSICIPNTCANYGCGYSGDNGCGLNITCAACSSSSSSSSSLTPPATTFNFACQWSTPSSYTLDYDQNTGSFCVSAVNISIYTGTTNNQSQLNYDCEGAYNGKVIANCPINSDLNGYCSVSKVQFSDAGYDMNGCIWEENPLPCIWNIDSSAIITEYYYSVQSTTIIVDNECASTWSSTSNIIVTAKGSSQ